MYYRGDTRYQLNNLLLDASIKFLDEAGIPEISTSLALIYLHYSNAYASESVSPHLNLREHV